MAKESGRKLIAQNRKARHDFHIEDTFEAGLVLTGTEVKSLRAGQASLVDGFGEVANGEAWLLQVHIPEYTQGTWTNHEARRRRKMLLNRHEIDKMEGRVKQKGYTLVPLKMYFNGSKVKLELGLGRNKDTADRREEIKAREGEREARAAMNAHTRGGKGR